MGKGYRSTTAQTRSRRDETCMIVVRREERTRPGEMVTVSSDAIHTEQLKRRIMNDHT